MACILPYILSFADSNECIKNFIQEVVIPQLTSAKAPKIIIEQICNDLHMKKQFSDYYYFGNNDDHAEYCYYNNDNNDLTYDYNNLKLTFYKLKGYSTYCQCYLDDDEDSRPSCLSCNEYIKIIIPYGDYPILLARRQLLTEMEIAIEDNRYDNKYIGTPKDFKKIELFKAFKPDLEDQAELRKIKYESEVRILEAELRLHKMILE